MSFPIIGITRCSKLDDYVASVEQAGAKVRVLEVSDSPRALVGVLNGVVLISSIEHLRASGGRRRGAWAG